jgi:hypothetical protein
MEQPGPPFPNPRKPQVITGVGEADVFHHAAEEREVVGEFAGFVVAALEIRLNRPWWRERFAV